MKGLDNAEENKH